jgi:hypothetical protein
MAPLTSFGEGRLISGGVAEQAFSLTAHFAIGKLEIRISLQRKETRFMFNSKSVLVRDIPMGASLHSS